MSYQFPGGMTASLTPSNSQGPAGPIKTKQDRSARQSQLQRQADKLVLQVRFTEDKLAEAQSQVKKVREAGKQHTAHGRWLGWGALVARPTWTDFDASLPSILSWAT